MPVFATKAMPVALAHIVRGTSPFPDMRKLMHHFRTEGGRVGENLLYVCGGNCDAHLAQRTVCLQLHC